MCRENDPVCSDRLSKEKIIGYGATSTVYQLSDDTVCKVFNREISFSEIQRESRMAESAWQLGIHVPKPFGIVTMEDRTGIKSQYISGKSLATVLSGEPGRYEEILPVYCGELKHFHETEVDAESFTSAKALYLEKIEKLSGTSWYTEEELQSMAELVRSVPDRMTFVFGDYHPKNIRMKDGVLYFLDLGDTCFGHPVFDFAMIANTHFIIPSVNPVYALKYFAVPPELMQRLWNDLFMMYFSDYEPEKQKMIRKQIMAFAMLRQGLSPADGRVFSKEVLAGNVLAVKRKLLPDIKRLMTEAIDW